MPRRRKATDPPPRPAPPPKPPAPRATTASQQEVAALVARDPEASITVACEQKLRVFVEEAWPTVVPAEPFQGNWHVDALCEHLEALKNLEIRDLLVNISPRVGKSTVISVMFPAWLWITMPTLRMLYSSYAQTLATRDSLATRQLIDSSWYQARWGSRFRISSEQNEKTRFQNDKKGYRLSTSVGGANTGEGGDLIACDDAHNVLESESELIRDGVIRWWNEVMSTRGNNPATRRRLVIMQRSHEKDLAGDILSQGGYCHLNLPMEFETKFSRTTSIGWRDPRRLEGEPMWPTRFTPAVLEKLKKNLGSYGTASQLQQRPAPLEGGMFRRDWWKFSKLDPVVLFEKMQDACWSWDMTFKSLEESMSKDPDYVCGLAWVRVGGDFYLLPHRVHDQIGFSASKAAVKTCSFKYEKIRAKLVEDKANGSAIINDLKREVPGLIPIEPEGGKEARASAIQPYVESGNVFLPDPSVAPWVEDFIEEFRVFPNGAHDDYVDSTSQALIWLLNRMHKGFAPLVASVTRSTTGQDDGERFRDAREGEQAFRTSDRGDLPKEEPSVQCLTCGKAYPETRDADHVASSPRCASKGFRRI